MRRILAGLAATAVIAAGALTLVNDEQPVTAARAPDVPKEQRFSVMCDPLHQSREDPFLNPIGTDQDHDHMFFGSAGIRTWPNGPNKADGMRDAGTSCEFSGDTASYWVPFFMDRNGKMIAPTQALVYYRHKGSGPVVPHPEDMLLKSFQIEWGCLDSDNFGAPPNCSNREVRMRVIFRPVDVNGTPTPRIAMNVRYDTRQGQGGHIMGGASGEHGNFFNTWNQVAYKGLIDLCLTQAGVASQTKAEWNDNCVKVSDGNQTPPSPSPTPSPSPSPSPSSSPSPDPEPINYETYVRDIDACLVNTPGRLEKLQCIRNVLRPLRQGGVLP